jgi:hypothetical protein
MSCLGSDPDLSARVKPTAMPRSLSLSGSQTPWGAALAAPSEFDLHPPVILMRGDGPFVISTDSPRVLVAKLNLKSALYIWGGPVAALWGLWEILRHARRLQLYGRKLKPRRPDRGATVFNWQHPIPP